MARLAARYPGYFWENNAGYGTPAHIAALNRLGATRHHRASFGAVRQLSLELFAQAPGLLVEATPFADD
jgi:ribonuclease HII